jgi:hypothetical protein
MLSSFTLMLNMHVVVLVCTRFCFCTYQYEQKNQTMLSTVDFTFENFTVQIVPPAEHDSRVD